MTPQSHKITLRPLKPKLGPFKRLKYYMFHYQPAPLFTGIKCVPCQFRWNPDLYKACPLCGLSAKSRWIVILPSGRVEGIYKSHRDALDAETWLVAEGSGPVSVVYGEEQD